MKYLAEWVSRTLYGGILAVGFRKIAASNSPSAGRTASAVESLECGIEFSGRAFLFYYDFDMTDCETEYSETAVIQAEPITLA